MDDIYALLRHDESVCMYFENGSRWFGLTGYSEIGQVSKLSIRVDDMDDATIKAKVITNLSMLRSLTFRDPPQ